MSTSPEAMTTKVKHLINRFLRPIGFEIITTRKERAETRRLEALDQRNYWSEPRYYSGLQFSDSVYQAFLQKICIPFKDSYNCLPMDKSDLVENGFFLRNGWFQMIDAEVLYSLIRYYHPKTIVEVGSGYSTHLMRKSIRDGELNTRIISIDPDPRVNVLEATDVHIPARVEHMESSALLEMLVSGDILFIDSSHQIMTGGDVPFLFLEILPHVPVGTLVHIHDIFLPFDYPKDWILDRRWEWTEQYLVHGFLCNNDTFEILWPARHMWELHKQDLLSVFPNSRFSDVVPSSLWIRKSR